MKHGRSPKSGSWHSDVVVAPLIVGLAVSVPAAFARSRLAPDFGGVDDAYIFLRYGRHLADGLGWVWNPGEAPVEGTTSTLWTLFPAVLFRLTDDPRLALHGLAVALVAAGLLFWIRAASATRREPLAVACAAISVPLAASPHHAVWTTTSGMDSGLWCAALLATGAALSAAAREPTRRRALIPVAVTQIVLAVVRPESLVIGPLFAFATLAAIPSTSRRPIGFVALGAAFAAQASMLLWRLSSFGVPLPNTYYAKVGDDITLRVAAGLRHLEALAARDPVGVAVYVAAAIAGIALLVSGERRRHSPALAISVAATLVGPAIALWVGGDHFPGHRGIEPFRPFAVTTGWLVLRSRLRPATSLVILLTVSALAYSAGTVTWQRLAQTSRLAPEFRLARSGLALGERLGRLFPDPRSRPRLGVTAAGAIPFAYPGESRDVLGLNDAAMARATRHRVGRHGHSAFDADAFFIDPPDLLIVGPRRCPPDRRNTALRRLAVRTLLNDIDEDPRFGSAYTLVRLRDETGTEVVCGWARRAWLATASGWEAVAEDPPG